MRQKVVVLTGAGISAESGLGTFRDRGGIWSQYDLAEVATPEGFAADPAKVLDFYNARRANLAGAAPHAAHKALAVLGEAVDLTLVTQNIDDLHEQAGSGDVIHMHGELRRSLCAACGARAMAAEVMRVADRCTACNAAALRPDVVWFGEMPYHMERIEDALAEADLFAAIGTSGEVYPAAGFVELARMAGAETVELNLEPSARAGAFQRAILGPASETVPAWVAGLVAGARLGGDV
ncbi:NAD-dependent deacylase [Oceanibium sediminis]|uniref:NAD-dependent deacylase n=1 Tax=Oceanibium sediminis TaxID=2026339 RepID=UPI000DD4D611|nr:NAD-dependent deacylase [Oceanibium sediminis]